MLSHCTVHMELQSIRKTLKSIFSKKVSFQESICSKKDLVRKRRKASVSNYLPSTSCCRQRIRGTEGGQEERGGGRGEQRGVPPKGEEGGDNRGGGCTGWGCATRPRKRRRQTPQENASSPVASVSSCFKPLKTWDLEKESPVIKTIYLILWRKKPTGKIGMCDSFCKTHCHG